MRLRSARRTSRADIVDRDVEQRSRNDARYHQRRAARHILVPRVPHRFHCLSSPGKCPLAPANARLEFCNQMRCASRGSDDRTLSAPRGHHKLLVRIAAELGCAPGGRNFSEETPLFIVHDGFLRMLRRQIRNYRMINTAVLVTYEAMNAMNGRGATVPRANLARFARLICKASSLRTRVTDAGLCASPRWFWGCFGWSERSRNSGR